MGILIQMLFFVVILTDMFTGVVEHAVNIGYENTVNRNRKGAKILAKTQRIEKADIELFPTCSYDLETTGLQGDFGYLLVGGIKPFGRPERIFRIDEFPLYKKEPSNDRALIAAFVAELVKYSIAISWNGVRFDMPFLMTRMIAHNMDIRPLSTIRQLDLIFAARYRMRLRSNSLAVVSEHLETVDKKTPLTGKVWAAAAAGDKEALGKIATHNIADLVVLEEVARRLIHVVDLKFTLIR